MPETALVSDSEDLQNLEDRITELAAHIHAATYHFLVLIREFDQRAGWSGPGLMSCAHWLSWKCGINLGAAREKVRVAHALEHLPGISEAFRTGRVSFSKVRAMTRVATPDNEDYLLMIADHGTAAHVERLVRNYRQVQRNEALEAENDRHNRRELTWYYDDDGSVALRARLTPEQGARVIQALNTATDAEAREHRDDRVAPGNCLPGAPTEPDVPDWGIRFLWLRIRCRAVHTMYHARWSETVMR